MVILNIDFMMKVHPKKVNKSFSKDKIKNQVTEAASIARRSIVKEFFELKDQINKEEQVYEHELAEDIYSLAECVLEDWKNEMPNRKEIQGGVTTIVGLALIIFCLTLAALLSVAEEVLNAKHIDILRGASWYEIPVNVTAPTRAAQILAIVFTVFTVSEEIFTSCIDLCSRGGKRKQKALENFIKEGHGHCNLQGNNRTEGDSNEHVAVDQEEEDKKHLEKRQQEKTGDNILKVKDYRDNELSDKQKPWHKFVGKVYRFCCRGKNAKFWNILRLMNGVYVCYICTLTIIAVDNALDLFKDLTAVVFIVEFDTLALHMTKFGLFGHNAQELSKTKLVRVRAEKPFLQKGYYRFGLLVLITLPFHIIFLRTWHLQRSFEMGCKILHVKAQGSDLEKISGMYHLINQEDWKSDYPEYKLKTHRKNPLGDFCICFNNTGSMWVLKICSLKNYKINIYAESKMETVKYDPASPDIEWRLKCGDEGFCIDGTVEISCRGACERDEDCGNGKCEEFEGQYSWNYKTCNCKGKNYGINCENPLPSTAIDITGLIDMYGMRHGPRYSLLPASINAGKQNGIQTSPIYYDLKSDPFEENEWHLNILMHKPYNAWEIMDIGFIQLFYDDSNSMNRLFFCFKPDYTKVSDQVDVVYEPVIKKARFCRFLYDGWLEDIIIEHRGILNNLPLVKELHKTNSDIVSETSDFEQLKYLLVISNQFQPFFSTGSDRKFDNKLDKIQLPFEEVQDGVWKLIDTRMKYTEGPDWKFLGCDPPVKGFSGIECDVAPKQMSIDITWKFKNLMTCFISKKGIPSLSQDGFCQVLYVRPFQFNSNIYGRIALQSNETHVNVYYDVRNATQKFDYSVPTGINEASLSIQEWRVYWWNKMSHHQNGRSLPKFCSVSNLLYSYPKKSVSYTNVFSLFLNESGSFKSISAYDYNTFYYKCTKDNIKQERIDGDWGHRGWGGNTNQTFLELVKLDVTIRVGKLRASSFVRKLTKIAGKYVVDVETKAQVFSDYQLSYFSLKDHKLLNFLESDVGDNINEEDWCDAEGFYTVYGNEEVMNNKLLIWRENKQKQVNFMNENSCKNVVFKKAKIRL